MPVDVRVEGWTEGTAGSVKAQAIALLEQLDLKEAELSIVLCDDAFIQPLNAQWRGKDSPTDVLSFPQRDEHEPDSMVLGDVVISLETAQRQAAQRGHSLEDEVLVLLVHGVLHLLGHDHEGVEDSAAMRTAEQDLLAGLGAGTGLLG